MPFCPQSLELPQLNSLVSFTGRLHSFERNTEDSSANALRVKVWVYTLSHLSGGGNNIASKKHSDTGTDFDDEHTVAHGGEFREVLCRPQD